MSIQVAVRLDDRLLSDLDWLVIRCGFENRAEAIRSALTELTERERHREIDERMVAAYTAMPQTADEIEWAGGRGFPGVPDEDWSQWL